MYILSHISVKEGENEICLNISEISEGMGMCIAKLTYGSLISLLLKIYIIVDTI